MKGKHHSVEKNTEWSMTLTEEINARRREIRTDGYSMSIGEWVSLYENKEIDIHPEFQRFYRWSEQQKTNLIESILLGIPIPPIFVSQRNDGIWDVVDGLQRLSTIYQFMGVLKDENGNNVDPFMLSPTKYLPALGGKKWNNIDDVQNSFTQELRLVIKRSKISASIILKESDEKAKFDLFQRLNTGGTHLSPQEVRNCILVMLNKDFYTWLQSLSKFPSFQETIALSDRPISEAYDIELALRFLIFSLIEEAELNAIGDVGVFITDKMSKISVDPEFDRNAWESLFKITFDTILKTLGDKAFKRFNSEKARFMGGFLLSNYEAVAYGLAFNIKQESVVADNEIEEKAMSLSSNAEFTEWSGSGMTATRRLPHIIPVGRTVFGNGN